MLRTCKGQYQGHTHGLKRRQAYHIVLRTSKGQYQGHTRASNAGRLIISHMFSILCEVGPSLPAFEALGGGPHTGPCSRVAHKPAGV